MWRSDDGNPTSDLLTTKSKVAADDTVWEKKPTNLQSLDIYNSQIIRGFIHVFSCYALSA